MKPQTILYLLLASALCGTTTTLLSGAELSFAAAEAKRAAAAESGTAADGKLTDEQKAQQTAFKQQMDAIRKFINGKEYPKSLTLIGELSKGKLTSAQQLDLLNQRILIYQRTGKNQELADAYLELLSCPALNPKQVFGIQCAFLDTLNRNNQYQEAIRYEEELLKDQTLASNQKMEILKKQLYTASRMKDIGRSLQTWDAMIALDVVTPDQKYNLMMDKANYLSQNKMQKEAEAIEKQLADGKEVPNRIKVRVFTNLSNRNIRDLAKVKEAAKPYLELKDLSADDFFQIQRQIMTAGKNAKNHSVRKEAAESILKREGMTNAQKIIAACELSEVLMFDNQKEEALKAAKAPLAYKDLTPNDILNIKSNLGKMLSWDGKCDEAVAVYREISASYPDNNHIKQNVTRLIANEYATFKRIDEAAKTYRDTGSFDEEARIYMDAQMTGKAKELALKILENDKLPDKMRRRAYEFFTDGSAASSVVRKKYLDVYVGDNKGSVNMGAFWQPIRKAMYLGNYPLAVELIELVRENDSNRKSDFELNGWYARALAATNKIEEAKKVCAELAKNPAYPALQRYRMALMEALFANAKADGKSFNGVLDQVNKQFDQKEVNQKQRSAELVRLGSTALIAKLDHAADIIAKRYDAQFKPEPKKEYVVGYADQPISGISDFLAMKQKPAPQLMDRQYGGNMDFLVTDVSTGDRGAGIASEAVKKDRKPTEFYAIGDVNGLHLIFRGYDEKAREVEAKLASAGAYEMYLAPGVNQPYTCFLPDLQSGQNSVWNTTYPNENHRRLDKTDTRQMRTEHRFLDDGYLTYQFVSWERYYDKLPDKGDIWEFENLHWGRAGGFGWNGTKSIHGRSTWGNLKFNFSPKQLNMIKRKIVFDALVVYKYEKRTGHDHHGIIDFWKDPVLGDIEFYEQKVKPFENKLDSYIPLVKADMSDSDVEKVFREAVPAWKELKFKLSDMRRKYLEDALSK